MPLMHLRCAVLFAAIALMLATTPSLTDMVIKFRDGHVITGPIQHGDIESLSLTSPNRGASTAQATAAPILLPNATAAVAAVLVSANDGAAAHLPANALVFPPMKSDRPSGRVLHVGPNRDLKVPSQAAHEAKDGDVRFVDAAHYDYNLRIGSPALDAGAIPYQPQGLSVTPSASPACPNKRGTR